MTFTLNEAIVHCYKKSQNQSFYGKDKCALEHKQLYEWLCELRDFRLKYGKELQDNSEKCDFPSQ